MSSAAVLARTVLLTLTDESSRRKIGWVLAAIFSPVILVVALLCCLLGGTSEHNTSMVELCFHGGALPESVPAEYRTYMEGTNVLTIHESRRFFMLCTSARIIRNQRHIRISWTAL